MSLRLGSSVLVADASRSGSERELQGLAATDHKGLKRRGHVSDIPYGGLVGDIPDTTYMHCFTDHRQVMTYKVGLGYLCGCSCGCRCPSRGSLASGGLLRLWREISSMILNGQSSVGTAQLLHALHVTRELGKQERYIISCEK